VDLRLGELTWEESPRGARLVDTRHTLAGTPTRDEKILVHFV